MTVLVKLPPDVEGGSFTSVELLLGLNEGTIIHDCEPVFGGINTRVEETVRSESELNVLMNKRCCNLVNGFLLSGDSFCNVIHDLSLTVFCGRVNWIIQKV